MTSEQEKNHRLLLFSLGEGLYGTHVQYIREIVQDQEKIPLPGAPEFIPGVIRIRSDIVKIIDMRRIIPLGAEGTKKKILIFIPESSNAARFGILVDEVFGIMDVPDRMVTHLDRSDSRIQNNFMLGSFNCSIQTFMHQNGRQHAIGDDHIVWIDFEDLIRTIINEGQTDSIVFRLFALFNPDYLLSGAWKEKRERTDSVSV
jgi:purine-binding chemotaxis protein CheW